MTPGLAEVARGVVLDGRYRIEDVLGQGGMATVYRAHDEVLGRDVAIKLFPPTPDGDEVRRHRSEMQVLARLSHPNLVMLHDAGSAFAGGPMQQTYLVMELVPGPTLADLLATGPLTSAQTARVGRQLAEALATVHEAGVVHRDIKPANVLLLQREHAGPAHEHDAMTTGPLVKIADFGIARLANSARLTMTGTTLGTATYLSPEQAGGRAVGPETDVYALGLVLLECLTGRKAFTGTVMEVAAARLSADPAIPASLGTGWCEVLTAMTDRDPSARPTMDEAATALQELEDPAPDAGVIDLQRTRRQAGADVPTAPGAAVDAPRAGTDAAEDVATAPHRREPSGETPSGPGPEHESTRPLRTAGILAVARARANGEASTTEPPPEIPPATDARRTPWLTLVLAVSTVALLLTVAVLVTRQADAATPPVPDYPSVEGDLGAAIDDLAEAVVP